MFILLAVAAVFGLAGAVFFLLAADAYIHVPVRIEVKTRHGKKNQQR